MKRLLFFLLLIPALAFSQQKISEMPTYIGNPDGSWVPIVQGNTNRKVDAAYFGYNKVDSISTSFGGIYDTVYVWKFGIKSFYFLTRASGGGGSTAWSDITGKPTTLSGYGITDAAALSHTHAFSTLTSKPTTLSGYGITDAAALSHTHAFSTLTSKPTTLAGYGITDAAGAITLTTTGNSGAATYIGGVLNIPAYTGGSGGGDASTNTSTSVDGELAVFSGTGGKTIKRITGTGIITVSSGVASAMAYGANGTVLKMVGGVLTFVNDTASLPIGTSLKYSSGVLDVDPAGASSAINKSITVATQTYTVGAGINQVFATYVGGTITITMPAASSNLDREITITNLSTNSLTVTPVFSGTANTFVTNNSGTFHSDGTNWICTKHS